MGSKKVTRWICFTVMIMTVLILLLIIPVSANEERMTNDTTSNDGVDNLSTTSLTDSDQILPDGVYRIYNWSSLQSLTVD